MIVILQQTEHETFKRGGIDLYVDKKLSLREALCGFEFVLEHLDGRKLSIKQPPGKVIAPGTCVRLQRVNYTSTSKACYCP